VKEFKSGRNQAQIQQRVAEIKTACSGGDNIMPVLIDAVDDGVTLGEVSEVFREVFGVYSDPGDI